MQNLRAGKIGVVTADRQLVSILKGSDMVYEMKINPRLVGFDPMNRGGLGCQVVSVFQLGQDIALLGFDPDLTKSALVVEAGPGDSAASQLRQHNAELLKGTEMAAVPTDQIQYTALASSHLSGFLRAMQANAPLALRERPSRPRP